MSPGVQCNAGTVHVLWRGFFAGLFHYRQEKVQCVGVAVGVWVWLWVCGCGCGWVGVGVDVYISAQTVTIHTLGIGSLQSSPSFQSFDLSVSLSSVLKIFIGFTTRYLE